MANLPRSINCVYLQYVAAAKDGRWLEVCIANDDGSLSSEQPYPLATILETDDYQMWLEIQLPEGLFRVKVEELERSIVAAREGVFSERRYIEQLCPKDDGA